MSKRRANKRAPGKQSSRKRARARRLTAAAPGTVFALIRPDNSIDRRDANVDPNVQTRPGWRWLPIVVTDPGAFDPATQVKEGPFTTVEAARVTDVYSVRAKTAAELSADKDSQIAGIANVLLQIAFKHENDIRTGRLAGQPAITVAQFKAAIKALL
jgi:hypothetical protein